jgi:hypothetical protein
MYNIVMTTLANASETTSYSGEKLLPLAAAFKHVGEDIMSERCLTTFKLQQFADADAAGFNLDAPKAVVEISLEQALTVIAGLKQNIEDLKLQKRGTRPFSEDRSIIKRQLGLNLAIIVELS